MWSRIPEGGEDFWEWNAFKFVYGSSITKRRLYPTANSCDSFSAFSAFFIHLILLCKNVNAYSCVSVRIVEMKLR